MAAQTQYETLYGISFLDDLHNYFPAILYDSGRFHTVPQLLQYIRNQARNRFDLFSFGERAYQDTQVRAQQRYTAAVSPVQQLNRMNTVSPLVSSVRQSQNDESENADDENEEDEEGEGEGQQPAQTDSTNLDRLLMVALMDVLANGSSPARSSVSIRTYQNPSLPNLANFLNSRDSVLNLGGLNIENLLQPVIVRPTREQILAGSEIIQLSNQEMCSICQENINTTDTARHLRACNHNFHQHCIDTWYERNVHCPICRHDIREQAQ